MTNRPKVAVVIPALNEEVTIAGVVQSLAPFVDEIIVVNDASSDHTAQMAVKSGAKVITHEVNQGYDKSLGHGFDKAVECGADIIISFDADGQHIADNIPNMIQPIIDDKADVVIGIRPYRARISEHLFAFVSKAKAGIHDPLCGFKVYRAEVYKAVGYFDQRSSIGTELMFAAHRKKFRILQQNINLNRRKDIPRFGRSLAANFKIMTALIRILPL